MIANPVTLPLSGYKAQHVRLTVDGKVATLTLNRPDKKNPLTFESYAEIANIFRAAAKDKQVKAFVITGEGGNFCSGGDVFEIIGPLVEMNTVDLLEFTRMTGEAVKAMRQCPQPIIAAIDGVCAGAGAILAMASDLRLGTAKAKVAFLFNRVGLAGCDMGACAILPRIIGQGRASELLYTGRVDGRRGGRALGLLQPARGARSGARRGDQAGEGTRRRPDLRQRHDQAHAGDGMGDVGRAGDRGRSGRAGAVHGDGGFRARLPRLRREAEAGVRGQLMSLAETLTLAVLRGASPPLRRRACALGRRDACPACRMTMWMRPAARASRRSARPGSSRRACRPNTAGCIAKLDVRTLCIAREILAFRDGLADFAFAMQGLGTGSISLYGTPELKQRYLPQVRDGKAIAAFALSEPEAGSDVAAMATTATPDGNAHVRIDGAKTWISNGGIADHYVVFARTGEGPGAKGLSAFMVDADTPGLTVAERIDVIAPHPLATLKFDGCRVPVTNRLGAPGEGFKVAMATLDIFRSTVGAAALGFARRALHETVEHAATRNLFGAPLGDLQMTQAAIADSATEVDAAALLVYRAAWTKDQRRRARHARSRDGEDVRDRSRAARDRPRRAAAWRARRHQGREGRGALSRNPRAAHLRRRDRGAEDRDRARGVEEPRRAKPALAAE